VKGDGVGTLRFGESCQEGLASGMSLA
jgi:hypothetical protein